MPARKRRRPSPARCCRGRGAACRRWGRGCRRRRCVGWRTARGPRLSASVGFDRRVRAAWTKGRFTRGRLAARVVLSCGLSGHGFPQAQRGPAGLSGHRARSYEPLGRRFHVCELPGPKVSLIRASWAKSTSIRASWAKSAPIRSRVAKNSLIRAFWAKSTFIRRLWAKSTFIRGRAQLTWGIVVFSLRQTPWYTGYGRDSRGECARTTLVRARFSPSRLVSCAVSPKRVVSFRFSPWSFVSGRFSPAMPAGPPFCVRLPP